MMLDLKVIISFFGHVFVDLQSCMTLYLLIDMIVLVCTPSVHIQSCACTVIKFYTAHALHALTVDHGHSLAKVVNVVGW
jgi:hypothetical protein